ncbi:MAG: 30S ribosomal protein S12 methylthiotransferase RimO [Synergistaceae bacterium]|jgi:ribosomal protein S12 methylthiotransferase|nr:30S ribosomal protein S12 methylthiotransferase RimO [Synergistaceae bacterium]
METDNAAPEFIRGTAWVLSMGCSKNTVDSERFAGVLRNAGFEIVQQAEGAEVCLVNTCGFLKDAVEENIVAILDLADLKSKGAIRSIAVVGCLVNRYGRDLSAEIPEVDFWGGCEDYSALLKSLTSNAKRGVFRPERHILPGARSHVRYIKISEGCGGGCSFCSIPSIRGRLHSLPVASIVREAESLASNGAGEICLVAQDLTAYGRDLGQSGGLLGLLDALESSLPEDLWIRLLYLQPSGVDARLIERMARAKLILPYFDIPIQHSSSGVLESMRRMPGRDGLTSLFATIREIMPDCALRTTCMVGFPGETRSDFADLLRFLDEVCFDRVGAFAFSPEEGTEAASMPRQVLTRTKKSRLERLMSHQAGISFSRGMLFFHKTIPVIIDTMTGRGMAEGRSFREAPDIDGVIEVEGIPRGAGPGDKIWATITEVSEHDMFAKYAEPIKTE